MSAEQIRLNKYMVNTNIALCAKFSDDKIEIEAFNIRHKSISERVKSIWDWWKLTFRQKDNISNLLFVNLTQFNSVSLIICVKFNSTVYAMQITVCLKIHGNLLYILSHSVQLHILFSFAKLHIESSIISRCNK